MVRVAGLLETRLCRNADSAAKLGGQRADVVLARLLGHVGVELARGPLNNRK
jgi:hypothetical protein